MSQKPRKAPEYDQEDVYPRPSDEMPEPHEVSPISGDGFNPNMGFGRTTAPPVNLEKDYGPYNQAAATAEEMFRAEQDLIKSRTPDLPKIITMKEEAEEARRADEEMQELMRMRENPVNQSPAARLPAQSLPPGSPPTVTPHKPMPPQVPGAATYPTQGDQSTAPLNPFAGYREQKPESGLPWKPPGAPSGFGKSFRKKTFTSNSLPSRDTGQPVEPPTINHDCVTVHGYMKHDDWQVEQYAKEALAKPKFFRDEATRGTRTQQHGAVAFT